MTVTTSIESVTLDVADPTAASRFYTAAFGLDTQVRLRASESPTTGFRGLMIGSDAGPFTDPDRFAWEAAAL